MRSILLALLALAGLSGIADAQPSPPVPAARWISRWDRGECQLVRAIGNAERLAIKVTPGSGFASFWVRAQPGTAVPQGASLGGRLTLSPSSASLETANVQQYRVEGDDLYIVTFADEAALTALASARALRLAVNEVGLIDLPLGNIAAGVDVLRQCMNDQLRAWGIDPATLASLRQRPVPLHEAGLAGFITEDDYPAEALQRGLSGAPIVRLDVGPEGRVVACSVLQSAGDAILDNATCRALTQRARFQPAVDAAGAPTTAPVITQVYWSVRDQ